MPKTTTTTRVLLAGIAGLALSAGVASAQECTPKHQFTTVEAGTLTVAVTT